MKKYLFVILFASFMLGAVPAIYAQDVTVEAPTQEVITATPQPTIEATVEPTPAPEQPPAPVGLSTNDLFLVVVVILALVGALLFSHSTTHTLALQLGVSAPEWAWQGVKATTISGLDALQVQAKKTIDTYDDDEVARLRKIAVDTITEIDAKRAVGSAVG